MRFYHLCKYSIGANDELKDDPTIIPVLDLTSTTYYHVFDKKLERRKKGTTNSVADILAKDASSSTSVISWESDFPEWLVSLVREKFNVLESS
ncbi:hypothetical protein C5167_050983 [Papaver somniferum]|uniref:Uncharacterized protein n=1 Tax=Papaver somniferum TaxID=3469 RepID=A0A4Y7KT13_PAPSO|nr:hypothetical protein C5167_050983 [Papaver somniferum]